VPVGTVISVRGAVVDVSFANKLLPPINFALVVEWDRPEPLVLEVHSHVDPATVRGIALQATAGLARDTPVRATMAPISIPVGEAVLGRLLDMVGAIRDRGPALPSDSPATWHPQSAARTRRRAGVGERSREGYELLTDMQGSGVLARAVLVYGQMNEPPSARWRVPLTAQTIAEYFRDQKMRPAPISPPPNYF